MTRVSKFEDTTSRRVDVPALLDALGLNDTRRNGRSIEARCPSHPDRNPSWSIIDDTNNPRNGLHHCFSCQFGGGPAALVKAVRGCTWEEAFQYLKGTPQKQLALEVDVVVGRYSVGVLAGMRVPSEVKVRPFEEWPDGARQYLVDRGVTAAEVVRYDLGYATSGRLAGRIVLPMKDRQGRVCSYTARDWTGQGKRYLEPQSSEGAQKPALFGEHLWVDHPTMVVTEGCFDAIAVARAVREASRWFDSCGLHGSRLHVSQAVKFSRYKRVIVATDSDPAGDAVAADLAEALGRYCTVVRARPPEGSDCASMTADDLNELIYVSDG